MSLSSTTNRVSYTGNGNVDTYSYTFRIFDEDDLLVTVRDTDDVETTLAKTTDYTVTGVGEAGGGTVVLVDNNQDWIDADGDLVTDYVISIRRVVALTQITDIRNQGDFYPEVHEDQFDKFAMIDQQQQDEIDRSVKMPETVDPDDFDTALPPALVGSAYRTMTTNATGDAFDVGPSAEEIENAEANAILAKHWASKVDGQVAATDYSSKAWAIGGTGVTDTASRGAAKEWATETASTVDGTDYSAKEWAKGTQTRGAASGGSSKDWANYTGGTVDDTEYSSKKYATDSASSAASAAASLAAIQAAIPYRDVVYLTSADSPVTLVAADAGKVYHCDCTSGAILINLPSIALVTSTPKMFGFVKTDSSVNKVTLDANGTDTLEGAATKLLERQNQGANIIADTDASPDDWTILSFGSSGSSGSGIVLNWFEDANSPALNTINRMQVYSFNAAEAQELYSEFTVPTDYVVGSQINYKAKFYSADTSGNVLLQTVATLIRKETDAVSSTTNQRTSTNSAVTLSAGTANEIQQITCDLSSTTGTINSVAISAGDTILVKLTRGTDTATGAAGFLPKQGEVRTT